jgi:hypothetical protein
MSKSCTLVIQSFGRENEYRRAVLTILSFYAYSSIEQGNTKVLLFTDKPEYFSGYLDGLPVVYILLTREKIKKMRGGIDFLHRMKIAVIEEGLAISEGSILYADSDSFFIGDPKPLLERLAEGKAFMHLAEFPFVKEVEDKTKTYQEFYALINRQDFLLADGSRLKVTPDHWSWNAGVMMLHPAHRSFIPDVYTLTEQFYPPTLNHASEQFAFALVLQTNTKLEACDSVIYHYWYRIKKQIADDFLHRHVTGNWKNLDLADKLNQVREWTKDLPELFEKHVWRTRDRAIQAFTVNNFSEGYRWAAKALAQKPFSSGSFLKDTLYHLKRQLTHK